MNICVLIPCFNESAAISQLVNDVKAKGLHVIVIDDASTDNTFNLAKNFVHENEFDSKFTFEKNQ